MIIQEGGGKKFDEAFFRVSSLNYKKETINSFNFM
jgi:hypothetical protein